MVWKHLPVQEHKCGENLTAAGMCRELENGFKYNLLPIWTISDTDTDIDFDSNKLISIRDSQNPNDLKLTTAVPSNKTKWS